MMDEAVLQKLRERGYKITPQRRVILEALTKLGKAASALEIVASARQVFPDMSLDTVYRNLNLFTDIGVTSQVNLRGGEASRFEIERDGHHHHLVCLKCGDAVCLDFCPIDEQDIAAAEMHGFKVMGHVLELYGYCPACR